MKRSFVSILIALLILSHPGFANAWNYAGHKIIATIAYKQLDDSAKKRVAEILKTHAVYTELWKDRQNNPGDEALALFWNASVFPDDARRKPYDKYNRPLAHYVNYRIMADQNNRLESPVDGENVINSYVAHLKKIRDKQTLNPDKAERLAWVFHQAGDIHQPLHAVSRFSKELPEGDKGGNEVSVPNPYARNSRGNNLHAYWDDLLGVDEDPEVVIRLADEIIAENPKDRFAAELTKKQIDDWAKESADLAIKITYKNLDPNTKKFDKLPDGYADSARKTARQRAALAGYRLADELKALVSP